MNRGIQFSKSQIHRGQMMLSSEEEGKKRTKLNVTMQTAKAHVRTGNVLCRAALQGGGENGEKPYVRGCVSDTIEQGQKPQRASGGCTRSNGGWMFITCTRAEHPTRAEQSRKPRTCLGAWGKVMCPPVSGLDTPVCVGTPVRQN